MKYYNSHGLLNAFSFEDVSENTLLITLENIALKEAKGLLTEEDDKKVIEFIEKMRNSKTMMFNNLPGVIEGSDKYISHDQYTSLCAFSARHHLDYHGEFWKKLKKNKFTYDNITGEVNKDRIVHFRDIIYIGYLNDSTICKLAMPILSLTLFWSFYFATKTRPTLREWFKGGCKEDRRTIVKTDGQLLTLIRRYGLQGKSKVFNFTWKICTKLANFRFIGGFEGIFKTYYHDNQEDRSDHPNRTLSNQINNYILD